MKPTRKLAAVMFTDIVGYTKMMQVNETKGLAIADRYRSILEKKVFDHHGQVLKHYGDGSLTIFNSVLDAIECAIGLQIYLQKEPIVPVRLGIHFGDIVLEKDDIYGDGVNLASRLESVSQAGSIIFSHRVHEELEHHPNYSYKSLGTYQLKNVKNAIEIYALTINGLTVPSRQDILNSSKVVDEKSILSKLRAWHIGLLVIVGISIFLLIGQNKVTNTGTEFENSIAVLPFTDYSVEGDQAWFCDGLTEQIISNLARLKDLKVIARTSSMKYKNTVKTVPEIGDELNVNHILEGSIRKSKEKIRITAQLINVKDGFHLWENDFDKAIEDFFEIQDVVSQAIAKALHSKITKRGDQEKDLKMANFSNTTRNIEAFQNFRLGKYHYDLYDSWVSRDYSTSLKYFDKAISADSMYADAYVEKANLLLAVAWRWQESPELLYPIIKECINKSIALNPNSGKPYVALGFLNFINDRNFKEAENNFQKAIQLAPNYDVCYAKYYHFKLALGEIEEAKKLMRKAISLNPLNTGYYSFLAESYWGNMQFDSALMIYESNLEMFPNDPYNIWGYGCANGFNRDYKKAINLINSIPGYKDNNFATAVFATMAGDTTYARDILENRLQQHLRDPNSWTWDLAAIYSVLGEYETAIDYLETNPTEFIYVALWFKPLRTHPRFLKLLRENGFDPTSFPN